MWCLVNNLLPNIIKTKEVTIDFCKKRVDHATLHISGDLVDRVTSFTFLEVHISEELNWSMNATDDESSAATTFSENSQEKQARTEAV